ncbi:MAG: PilN domain-containing protein [Cyanobacteria bacterium J069]|nr:MAG: hypothetical protein D6742_15350 [Cyanobacteria bacterium J069]
MYSLDVNFLNDRTERLTEGGPAVRNTLVQDSPRPMYIGAAIGALLPGLVGGLWFFLQSQNASLTARQAELDSQLATLQQAMQEVQNVNAQVAQLDAENRALAQVFDRIIPWSAILQDVRGRVPAGVQITNIVQSQPEAIAAPPPADPSQPAPPPEIPPSKLEITGNARTFAEANDLVLLLQQSPFLDSSEIRLLDARLIDNPTQIEFAGGGDRPQGVQVQLPKLVQYKITAGLTPRPSSELLQDMENTLSVGLPARIDQLRKLGVVTP